MLTTANALS